MNKQWVKGFVLSGLMVLSSTSFAQLISANQYHCKTKNIEVSYSASSFAGEPLLNVTVGKKMFSAKGSEITVQPTVLGNLVSLVKTAMPDNYTEYMTVLLPNTNVTALGVEEKFSSSLFITRSYTSIAGPDLVEGVIEKNNSHPLKCTATAVVF